MFAPSPNDFGAPEEQLDTRGPFTAPPQARPQMDAGQVDFGANLPQGAFSAGDAGENPFGEFSPNSRMPPPQETPTPEQSILSRYSNDRNAQLDEYIKLLQSPPKREDYKPGAMDAIASMLVGAATGWHNPAAGYKAGTEILDRKYNQAQGEYEGKVKNFGAIADIGEHQLNRRDKIRDLESDLQTQIVKNTLERDRLIQQGWTEIKDELNGQTIMYNRQTGEKRAMRTSLTSAEKTQQEKDLQTQKDKAAMSRTQATQAGANSRNAATIAGANERNAADNNRIMADKDKPDVAKNIQRLAAKGINIDKYFTYSPDAKVWMQKPEWVNTATDPNFKFQQEIISEIKQALNPDINYLKPGGGR